MRIFNSFVKKPVYFGVAWAFRTVLVRLPALCTYFDAMKLAAHRCSKELSQQPNFMPAESHEAEEFL